VVCYNPMAKGLLTGGFTPERAASLPDNDHRRRDPDFQPSWLEVNLRAVERVAPIAEAMDRPLEQLPIAWTLRRPEVTSAIVGVRNRRHAEQAAGAGDWALTEEELAVIDRALDERRVALEGGSASQR